MALLTATGPLLEDLEYNDLSTNDKARVDGLITSTQIFLEDYLNRKLELLTFTDEKHDGKADSSVLVKNPPIRSLTSIKVRFDRDTTTTFGPNYFEFTPETGEIEWSEYNITVADTESPLYIFPRRHKNVLVTYDGGLDHYSIKVAAAEMIKSMFENDLNGAQVFEKLGNYAYKKEGDGSGGRQHPKSDELFTNIFRHIMVYRVRKA